MLCAAFLEAELVLLEGLLEHIDERSLLVREVFTMVACEGPHVGTAGGA
jgi:hypothetical protein